MKKWLLIVLVVLVSIAIILGIWQYFGKINLIPVTLKNETPVKVGELKNATEEMLGTIIYPSAPTIPEAQKVGTASQVAFDVPDSLDGVINIYSQDLLNRYGNYSVTKREVRKTDALNQKATILTCSSSTGKIIVTAFPNKNGLTSVEIRKDNSF